MRYFNTDPEKWSVPGGEPIREVQKRMTRAIQDLAARHDGQAVAVVSHGMAIRAYLCTVLGIPNSEMSTLPYGDNTSVSLLLVDGERTTVEYYNDNRHLPPALSTFGRQTWWRGSGSGAENLRYEQLTFPHDEAFYLQCYRDAWCNVHGSDEGFVPELYARSAAKHAQEHPGSVVRVLSGGHRGRSGRARPRARRADRLRLDQSAVYAAGIPRPRLGDPAAGLCVLVL